MDEVIHDSMSELDNLSAYLSKLRDMTRAARVDGMYLSLILRLLGRVYRCPCRAVDYRVGLRAQKAFPHGRRVRDV